MANPPSEKPKKTELQYFLIVGLAVFFFAQFFLLSPAALEDDFGGIRVIDPKNLLALLKNQSFENAPPEVPADEVPTYSLKENQVFAAKGAKPTFKMVAASSSFYQKENMVHAKTAHTTLSDGTTVDSKDGIFFLDSSVAKFYGSVHTIFTNGATLDSEYAEVYMKPITRIVIPTNQLARGEKKDKKSITRFASYGLTYLDDEKKILDLTTKVQVEIIAEKITHVTSDHAAYNQLENILNFDMNEFRPTNEQFVKVKQPDLQMKSRILVVNMNEEGELETITGVTDVWIKDEHDPEKIQTATGGRATYIYDKNDLELTDFPQVYQEGDTITGDMIIFHRNTDKTEVKQSNAIYRK